jgi:hypothetical protein
MPIVGYRQTYAGEHSILLAILVFLRQDAIIIGNKIGAGHEINKL